METRPKKELGRFIFLFSVTVSIECPKAIPSPKTICLLTVSCGLIEVDETLLHHAVKHVLQRRQVGVLVLMTGLA